VFWIWGYVVVHPFDGINYLDENKRPLKENVVVWMVREYE